MAIICLEISYSVLLWPLQIPQIFYNSAPCQKKKKPAKTKQPTFYVYKIKLKVNK